MKTIVVIILTLMTLGTSAYASPISQQWIKTYEGSVGSGKAIQQTIDGGYVVVGVNLTDDYDVWVLKLDSNGNVSWRKNYPYDGSWINHLYCVLETTDGGYLVAGYFGSFTYDGGWILKLDSNGDILWQKAYIGITQFSSIRQTSDGNYIVAGGRTTSYHPPNDNIAVLKLSDRGDILWQKSYDLAMFEESIDIQPTIEGGYIVAGQTASSSAGGYDIWVLKLDRSGNILWQKIYGGELYDVPHSIQQTLDGGYIVVGSMTTSSTASRAWVIKLDSGGEVTWQKSYDFGETDNMGISIHQNPNGEYLMLGGISGVLRGDIWLLKLDNIGEITWQRTYGGNEYDIGVYHAKTIDGGYAIAGNTSSFYPRGLMVIKLDSNGDLPDCDRINVGDATVIETTVAVQPTNALVESFPITVTNTNAVPQDVYIQRSVICYYENSTDIDGDGIENNQGGTMASSVSHGSFLAGEDNCSETPNGHYLGTCTKGNVGSTCIANEACGFDGICSMNQEDSYPPQGNNIGDSCDCEGDFDCDGDCDGTDAATFKADFGRSTFENPCVTGNPCNGDFDCDGDCDGTDAAGFKVDFGRSSFNNPCPACEVGEWCIYPLP